MDLQKYRKGKHCPKDALTLSEILLSNILRIRESELWYMILKEVCIACFMNGASDFL